MADPNQDLGDDSVIAFTPGVQIFFAASTS